MIPKSFKLNLQSGLLGLIMLVFFSLFLYLSLAQHWGLKTHINDLGNMSQPLWNSLHGNFMEMSNTNWLPYERMSRFAGHTNFIFLFLIPVYAVWSDPVVLLVIQVLMATLAGVPLFLLGKHLFPKKPWFWLIGPVVYYLNPMLHDAVLYDMHAVVLALPFLLFSIYFLEIKNYKWFWISVILLMLSKEDMSLLVAMMGVWHGLRTRDYKKAVTIFLTGIITFGILTGIVMPYFRQGQSEGLISDRYGHLGGSIDQIILAFIFKPHLVISDLLAKGGISYMLLLFTGFGFLPMLASVTLVILPSIAINLLSNNPITYQPFGYYYLATSVAILAAGVLFGLKNPNLKKVVGFYQSQTIIILIVFAIGFSWFYSPAPYSRVSNWSEFKIDHRWDELQNLQTMIPAEASLSIQNNLGPHFINRADIVQFPYRSHTSEYVLIDVTDPYTKIRGDIRQRNFSHATQLMPQEYYDSVVKVLDDPNYGVVYAGDGFILFKKGANQDLNTAAYQTLRQRAEIYFAPLQLYAPTTFYEPGFLGN